MKLVKTLDEIDCVSDEDSFFDGVLEKIRKLEGFRIELLVKESEQLGRTDNRITSLVYDEEFVVASALRIRNKANYTTLNFMVNIDSFKDYLIFRS